MYKLVVHVAQLGRTGCAQGPIASRNLGCARLPAPFLLAPLAPSKPPVPFTGFARRTAPQPTGHRVSNAHTVAGLAWPCVDGAAEAQAAFTPSPSTSAGASHSTIVSPCAVSWHLWVGFANLPVSHLRYFCCHSLATANSSRFLTHRTFSRFCLPR